MLRCLSGAVDCLSGAVLLPAIAGVLLIIIIISGRRTPLSAPVEQELHGRDGGPTGVLLAVAGLAQTNSLPLLALTIAERLTGT